VGKPSVCENCGTIYASGTVGGPPPAISDSKCRVCGNSLVTLTVRSDYPAPPDTDWLMSARSQAIFYLVGAVALLAALVAHWLA